MLVRKDGNIKKKKGKEGNIENGSTGKDVGKESKERNVRRIVCFRGRIKENQGRKEKDNDRKERKSSEKERRSRK